MKDWDVELEENGSDIHTFWAKIVLGILTDALATSALNAQDLLPGQGNNHWASAIRVNGRKPEASSTGRSRKEGRLEARRT